MARRSITDDSDENTEINLSPMIDCIFILLIFFIVTTVFVEEEGFAINQPEAAPSSSDEESENLTIVIRNDNKILVDNTEVLLSQIPALIRRRVIDEEDKVIIKPDTEADIGIFVPAYNAVLEGGASAAQISYN